MEIQPLEDGLTDLTTLPSGYQYGVVDGDVVKYGVGTRLDVDAIRALTR